MFKFVKGLSSDIIKEIFQLREECHQLKSRGSLQVQLVSTVFNSPESVTYPRPKIYQMN